MFLLYLWRERLSLDKKIRRIPLRICITGTRGKSSVTRLIASSLRENGLQVLAKTTGSKPVIIFPDGREEEIKRRSLASILEQKRLLQLGEKLGIDVLVCEMMGIHPESGKTESSKIIRPQILAITNIRLDHLSQMGSSTERIARVLASWIPEGSTVFAPQGEYFSIFQKAARECHSKIIRVLEDSRRDPSLLNGTFPFYEWKENVGLALAVVDFMKVDYEVALRGMEKSKPDFGSLRVWKTDWGLPPRRMDCVSGFAANDPESTGLIISSLMKKGFFDGKKILGLINLREDRGDRTLQWIKALESGALSEFSRFYLVGLHAHAFRWKFKGTKKDSFIALKSRRPEDIMSQILEREKEECVLVGMGNIGGVGKALVDYWERVGKSYDL